MTQSSALKFNQLIGRANGLGRSMKLLHKATVDMPEPPHYDDFFQGFDVLAEELWAIATVLTMIRETPNGYINPEAMETLQSTVAFAAGVEQEAWAQEVLKSDTPLAP
jgi:hypothetical protein